VYQTRYLLSVVFLTVPLFSTGSLRNGVLSDPRSVFLWLWRLLCQSLSPAHKQTTYSYCHHLGAVLVHTVFIVCVRQYQSLSDTITYLQRPWIWKWLFNLLLCWNEKKIWFFRYYRHVRNNGIAQLVCD